MAKSLRILQLLELIITRPGISLPEIVQELGISERTVYRYLNTLSGDLGAPVYCLGGGYHINGSAFLGPLNLTPQEMLATAFSLRTSPAAATTPLSAHAKSAMRKIEMAVNSHAMQTIRPVLDRSAAQPIAYAADERPELTERLLDATFSGSRLAISYYSARSGREKNLVFDPYAIAFRRHSWYLVGHSLDHERVIQLKVLRIREAAETGEKFDPPEDFTVQDFYSKSWEVWAGEPETEVRVRFSAEVAPIIKEARRHPSQILEEQPDGSVLFSARVSGTREIGFWILSWGADAEVLGPPELRESMAATSRNMADVYHENISEDSGD